MAKNKSEDLERIVELLERSLTPGSVVERNVRLPIIGSTTGAFAQCDVVITEGPPHRQTRTIVEVQNRNSPVSIGDFRNWERKREEVDAQHLYCVSRLDFPKSIKEKAVASGHTIKLITLEKLDDGKIPLDCFNFTQVYHDADIWDARKLEVIFPELESRGEYQKLAAVLADLQKLATNDYKFSFDQCEVFAISTICLQTVPTNKDVEERKEVLELGYHPQQPAFYLFNNEFIRIKLKMAFTWRLKSIEMPAAIWSYKQNDHGELAWLFECHYQSPRGLIISRVPVVNNSGTFTINNINMTVPQPMYVGLQLVKMAVNP